MTYTVLGSKYVGVYKEHLRKIWILVRGELQCEQVGEGSSVNRYEWAVNVWPEWEFKVLREIDGLGAWDWFEIWAKREVKASTMWDVLVSVSVEVWSVCGVEKKTEPWMAWILFPISEIGVWGVKEVLVLGQVWRSWLTYSHNPFDMMTRPQINIKEEQSLV